MGSIILVFMFILCILVIIWTIGRIKNSKQPVLLGLLEVKRLIAS